MYSVVVGDLEVIFFCALSRCLRGRKVSSQQARAGAICQGWSPSSLESIYLQNSDGHPILPACVNTTGIVQETGIFGA